jgi:hypothetical protein
MNMKLTRRVSAAGISAVVLATGALLSSGGTVHASTPPPWEPDGNSVGGLIFYNSAGTAVTGGNINDPIAAYVQGSKAIRSGDNKATLYGYLPKDGVPPGSWQGEIVAGPSLYPPKSGVIVPAPVSTTLPLVIHANADLNIADLEADFPNTDVSADGYAGLYQLRLETTAPGKPGNPTYDSADIAVTGTGASDTWSVVYTKSQVATKTTLVATPTSAVHGAAVKLTATVSPATAGTVKFFNGTKLLKSVAAVKGKASFSTKTLTDGVHKIKATFTPTNVAGFAASTSTVHSVTVKAHATKVTLKASAASVKAGKKLTLSAVESPAVAGKVTFYDGTKKLATVTVKKGKATFSSTKLKAGSHSLKARFTPTNTQNDAVSTSKVVKVKVTK